MRRSAYRKGWLQRSLAAAIVGAAMVATPIAAGAEAGGFAEPDLQTTTEDVTIPVVIDVLGNDAGGAVITGFSQGSFGTVAKVVFEGVTTALAYQPNADANGIDEFTYTIEVEGPDGPVTEEETVTVTVDAVPDAPTAVDDSLPLVGEIVENSEAVNLTAAILDNDSDVDGDNLMIVAIDALETEGDVTLDGGQVWFEPTSDSATSTSFGYTVADDSTDTLESSATVTVAIAPLDDAPVANPVTALVDEGESVSVDVANEADDVDGGANAVVSFGTPAPDLGSVSLDDDSGELVYVAPGEIAVSTDVEIPFELNGGSEATLTVTVSPVDDAPEAVADSETVVEGGSVLVDVLSNDTDVDGGPFEILETTSPAVGSVAIAEDGSELTYTHSGDSLDDVTFSYTINGGSQAEVTISVTNGDDDLPIVDDASLEIDEDADPTVVVVLADGAVDADGENLFVSASTDGTLGTTEINDDGDVVYTPNADANGADSFTVTISEDTNVEGADAESNTVDVTVNVQIAAINDAPIAGDDYYDATSMYGSSSGIFVFEDSSIELPLLANDFDPDIDGSVSIVMESIDLDPDYEGSVSQTEDGVFFTPAQDMFGYLEFSYVVTDGELESEPASVSIFVINTSDAPDAGDDEVSVDEDDVVYVDVLDNDFDVDGYLDDEYYDDDDFFFEDIRFLRGPDAGSLEIIEVSQPDGGYAAIAGDQIRVEPDPDFTGTLEIEYRIRAEYEPDWNPYYGTDLIDCDSPFGPYGPYGPGIRAAGLDDDDDGYCPTTIGTLIVNVDSVNDAPVAENDSADIDEDEIVSIDVLANDSDIDGDDLSIWSVGTPANGSVEIAPGTPLDPAEQLIYTPDADYFGDDSFVYYVTDGDRVALATVEITIASVNDLPEIADVSTTIDEDEAASFDLEISDVEDSVEDLLVGVDSEPAVGSVEIDGTTVTFTPPANYFGSVTFSLSVEDTDGARVVNSVTVDVESVNDVPTVSDVSGEIDEDDFFAFILDMDDVEDGSSLTVSVGEEPVDGEVDIEGDSVVFTPSPDWNGDASFTLVVTDSDEASAEASISVTVNAVNDKPTASDMNIEVDEDDSVTFEFDTRDVDGDELKLSLVNPPALLGTVEFDGTEITWSPSTNYAGPMLFEVRVDDGSGLSAIAEIFGTVNGVNDIPVIADASASVDEDGSVEIEIDAYDIDGFPVTIAVTDGPASGSTTVDGLTVTYTPDADVDGDDTFQVEVTDNADTTATATVSVAIAPVQDVPTASPCGPYTVEAGSSISILASDCAVDVDGDLLSVVPDSASTSVGSVEVGLVSVSFIAPEEPGDATVSFTVSDGNGGIVDASATVEITAPANPYVGMSGLEGEVVRVYSAMLGRQPDQSGFDFWVDQRTEGMTFEQMVDRFADSPEFKSIYGDMIRNATDEEWVEFVYAELMNRASEAEGAAFWLDALDSGRFSRSAMVIFFAQSPEYRGLTETL